MPIINSLTSDNKLATTTNEHLTHFKRIFSGNKDENIDIFLREFVAFCSLSSYSDELSKFFLSFALTGEALNWYRTVDISYSLEQIVTGLRRRFPPSDKILACMRQLRDLRPSGNSFLAYLDSAKLFASSGNISEEVLVANATIGFPSHISSQLIMSSGGNQITWERLYEFYRGMKDVLQNSNSDDHEFTYNYVKRPSNKYYCKYCRRNNHTVEYCFKKQKDENGSKKS
ncbi:hypothetical protein ENBRE01_1991 [Enteropsectra breve]|nr:hypothetical protein ENBRE01_1991 [Enteropsectra breve]